jgi:GNAT superfamily N-acetyltransferase
LGDRSGKLIEYKIVHEPNKFEFEQASNLLSREPNSPIKSIIDSPEFEFCLLLKVDNSLVGFIVLKPAYPTVEVYRFYIAPEFRGCGLAGIFLDLLIDDLVEAEFEVICFESLNEKLEDFWRQLMAGYREESSNGLKFCFYISRV